ncbi:MAG: hypothetical protein K2N13_10395 [Paraprevotella sp.]|nr:hypothetical protein [Paraprevotella sp.]
MVNIQDINNIPELQSPFEQLKEVDADGREWGTRAIFAPQPKELVQVLSAIDERLSDLDLMRDILLTNETSRSAQASATGNSKLIAVRSCPGFPVNTYEPISCILNGRELTVKPEEGSFLFITDWQSFSIPKDVIVVGIENMENFRKIRQQRALFDQTIGIDRLLFVSRYPQSSDLRFWLQSIPNHYIHFGDFDLAGIHIFLTEFHACLGVRSSFFIPTDIERRLEAGSMEKYNAQYHKFKNLSTTIPDIQHLIDTINNHHRCYDQEGYIDI